ncbi:MAG: 2-C-methyl-D-erythritol 4-phosphate cytidylyltransferase [Candidatus Cloacimonetes bacterium]|nr:2-C-methyl-D-erythritol 4-phosphate cytidylyltransferase [Candidatus Cloacimonadota bacterium]
MSNYAIITAGGSGKRLPGFRKKQFLRLGGVPVFLWPVMRFLRHPSVGHVVLVLPKDDYGLGRDILEEELLHHDPAFADRLWFTMGGDTRQESVFNGLQTCPDTAELVLVHDGVRPFVHDEDIDRLLEAAGEVGAAIPVHPVKHTVKQTADGRVVRTLDRRDLVEVSTPQVFRRDLLLACHEEARRTGLVCTDDAGLLEQGGHTVAAVPVTFPNLKITERFDLIVAEHLLQTSGETFSQRS